MTDQEREQPMASSKVVVVSEDDAERLGAIAGCLEQAASENVIHPDFGNRDARFLRKLSRTALQQEGQEARTEYRVCVGCEGEPPIAVYDFPMELDEARRIAREEAIECPVTVQSRTVTQTPWIDLDDQEAA